MVWPIPLRVARRVRGLVTAGLGCSGVRYYSTGLGCLGVRYYWFRVFGGSLDVTTVRATGLGSDTAAGAWWCLVVRRAVCDAMHCVFISLGCCQRKATGRGGARPRATWKRRGVGGAGLSVRGGGRAVHGSMVHATCGAGQRGAGGSSRDLENMCHTSPKICRDWNRAQI